MLVDGLPIGQPLSFAWSLLVSMSFQFVGFLLTYLLHTTHAARAGSRAGLGITLIQYGFYLRQQAANGQLSPPPGNHGQIAGQTLTDSDEIVAIPILAGADGFLDGPPPPTEEQLEGVAETNEWVALALMSVGWFVLFSSVLTYIRLYRWSLSMRSGGTAPDPSADPASQSALGSTTALLRRVGGQVRAVPGLVRARAASMHRSMTSRHSSRQETMAAEAEEFALAGYGDGRAREPV